MKKSIVLLSSGLDSTVSLAVACRETEVLMALYIAYGHDSSDEEWHYSEKTAEYYKIPYRIISLDWYKELHHINPPVVKGVDECGRESAAAVWFPNRNGLFINIAACFAESLEADLIVIGANLEEAATFPDNSSEFLEAANRALEYSSGRKIEVVSYLQDKTKAEIAQMAVDIQVPLENIYMCYRRGSTLCGCCESCIRYINAFREIGRLDLIEERFRENGNNQHKIY